MLLAAALALLPLQDSPELLPAVPDGWRFERLEFPLSFAPDLEYEGFEELAFAPGMFDPRSDSYFSYALDIELAGDHDFDGQRLAPFLLSYYRGLCEAVGADREPPSDFPDVSVSLTRAPGGHVATIRMVDAFVTGEPLTLTIEVERWAGPQRTELFGIASPLPGDAPIWTELRALRERWRAERALPVLLGHVTLNLDGETLAAIRAADEFRALFGAHETTRGGTNARLRLFGTRTIVDLLHEDLARRGRGLLTDVGFVVEREGGLDALQLSLAAQRIVRGSGMTLGEYRDGTVASYREWSVRPEARESVFAVGARSYGAERPASMHRDLARLDVVDYHVAKLGQTEAHTAAVVEDVREVFVDLTAPDAALFARVAEAFGYETHSGPGGVVHIGPSVRVVVQQTPGPSRVTGFRLALREPVAARRTLTFGRASLSLAGRAATFHYRP